MRSLWLLIALAGCIESSLVPCDENLCPVGTACGPTGACVAADQLTACLGLEETEPCVVAAGEGVCMLGVCQPLICGNGFITPGEVCDDGNNQSGDQCSADCMSDESCGNGFLDPRTEACDDGNADDTDDCRNSCVLARCGDGIVDPIEQCEPALAEVTPSCEDLGFYEGEVTCGSFCRYSTDECVGTCGDGEIQTLYEECDGAPPPYTCVDQGYDYGVLECRACGANLIGSCGRFDWIKVLESGSSATRIRADGSTIVLLGEDTLAVYRSGALAEQRRGSFVDADVAGERVLIAERNRASLLEGSTSMDLPSVAGDIRDAALDPDGTVSLLATDGVSCAVQRLVDGTFTATPMPAGCANLFVLGNGEYVVSTATGLTWVRPGTTVTAPVGSLIDIVPADGSTLVAYSRSGKWVVRTELGPDGTPGMARTIGTLDDPTSVAIYRDAVFFTEQVIGGDGLYRSEARRAEPLAAPGFGGRPIFGTARDGRLLLATNGVVYRPPSMIESARRFPTTNVNPANAALSFGLDGSLALCGTSTTIYMDSTSVTVAGGNRCTAVAVRTGTDVFIARQSSGFQHEILHYLNGTTTVEAAPGGEVLELVVTADTAVAVLSSGVLQRTDAGWQLLPTLPLFCVPAHVAISQGKILASCSSEGDGSGLYQLDGSFWTRILVDEISGIAAFPDGSVAIAGTGAVSVRPAGAITFTALPSFGVQPRSLTGTSVSDLVVSTTEGLWLWNGTVWSPTSLPSGEVAATPSELGLLFQDGFLGDVEYRGVIRGL